MIRFLAGFGSVVAVKVRRKSAGLFSRGLPKALQPGCHIGIEDLQELPLAIECHRDRGVAEAGLN